MKERRLALSAKRGEALSAQVFDRFLHRVSALSFFSEAQLKEKERVGALV